MNVNKNNVFCLIIFCLVCFAQSNLLAKSTPPAFEKIVYPETEITEEHQENVYASIEFELKISKTGELIEITVLDSSNIPKERLQEFIMYFKQQLKSMTITPAMENGKPVPSIISFPVFWHLFKPKYKPTPTLMSVSQLEIGRDIVDIINKRLPRSGNNEEFINKIKLPDGRIVTVDDYRKELDLKARTLMSDKNLETVDKGSAIIVCNRYDPMKMDFMVSSILATQTTFLEVFEKILPPNSRLDQLEPVTAYIFRNYDLYKSFKEHFGMASWAHGSYFGRLKCLTAYVGYHSVLRVRETLIHETIHAMTDQCLFKNRVPPRWLNEGLAEYFANSRISKSGIMLYGIVDHNKYINKKTNRYFYTSGKSKTTFLIKNRKRLQGNVIENLILGKLYVDESSSCEEVQLFYASSFGLVNYLLGSYKKGVSQDFLNYLSALGQGHDPITSFTNHFGPMDEVEKAFWKHVKKM